MLLGKMLFYRESVIWLFHFNECLLYISLDKAMITQQVHTKVAQRSKMTTKTFKNTKRRLIIPKLYSHPTHPSQPCGAK